MFVSGLVSSDARHYHLYDYRTHFETERCLYYHPPDPLRSSSMGRVCLIMWLGCGVSIGSTVVSRLLVTESGSLWNLLSICSLLRINLLTESAGDVTSWGARPFGGATRRRSRSAFFWKTLPVVLGGQLHLLVARVSLCGAFTEVSNTFYGMKNCSAS